MPSAHAVHTATLRAACLRGISLTREGPQAVVAMSAEQHLVLPLPWADLPDWQARVGRRVWLDLDAQPARLEADPQPGAGHD